MEGARFILYMWSAFFSARAPYWKVRRLSALTLFTMLAFSGACIFCNVEWWTGPFIVAFGWAAFCVLWLLVFGPSLLVAFLVRVIRRTKIRAIEAGKVPRTIAGLEAQLAEVIGERDALTAEILKMNEKISELERSQAGQQGLRKFERLKRVIASELHPDAMWSGSSVDRAVRSEMFKLIWPKVVEIDGS